MTDDSKALEVIDRTTGEVLDVRGASLEQLAAFCTNMVTFKAMLKDHEDTVNAELLKRLDADGLWTQRAGDPEALGFQWEIKAASPEAGTTKVDAALLEAELRALVARGTISAAAADRALERTVTITLTVPLDVEMNEAQMEREAKALGTVRLFGHDLPIKAASAARKPVAKGLTAIGKVSGTAAALKRATIDVDAPARRARVTLKERG